MHVVRREKTDFLEKLAFEEATCFFNCLSQDVSLGRHPAPPSKRNRLVFSLDESLATNCVVVYDPIIYLEYV